MQYEKRLKQLMGADADWEREPPAAEEDLQELRKVAGEGVPEAYLAFLRCSNGGRGALDKEPYAFDLWPVEEVIEENFRAGQDGGSGSLPHLVEIGVANGMALVFDTRVAPWKVCAVWAWEGGDPENAQVLAESFEGFLGSMGRKERAGVPRVSLEQADLPSLRQAEFSRDYFFIRESDPEERAYPDLDGLDLVIPATGDFALVLSMDTSVSMYTLYLVHPSAPEPLQLGWDDPACGCPYALRWEELDVLCRCIARRLSHLPYPGLVFLLLSRFAPVVPADSLATVRSTMLESWRQLGTLTEAEAEQITDVVIQRGRRDDWAWMQDTRGRWVLEGEWACDYSLRCGERKGFPHSMLRKLLKEAERCAGAP